MCMDSEKVHLTQRKGIPILTFPILEKYPLVHGFSTKLGGVSQGDCATMNLSFTRGDLLEHVKENYQRFTQAVGCQVEELVLTEQVHSTTIRLVGKEDTGEVFLPKRSIHETDGLITNEAGVVLVTFFADCVPLLFYDPVQNAVGNAHSGWRGTVERMGQKMVERMRDELGCYPKDLIVVIGPSICQGCYEVSQDVICEFQKSFDESLWNQIYYQKSDEKFQLNLWQANRLILEEAGVRPENICISGLCTNCHPELLFSHRFTNGRRGNLAAMIGLKA